MRSRIPVLIIALCAFTLPLTAEYVLETDYEVQFPGGSGWDIRCVMNDSTYATVWALGDTIYWNTEPGGVVSRSAVPNIITSGWESWTGQAGLTWVRLSDRPDHYCVVWNRCLHYLSGMEHTDYYEYYFFLIVDLSSGEVLEERSVDGSYSQNVTWFHSADIYLEHVEVQPRLPALSQFLFFCQLKLDWPSGIDTYIESSEAWNFQLAAPYTLDSFRAAHNLSFYKSDTLRCAFGGLYHEVRNVFDDPITIHHEWVGRMNFSPTSSISDYTHGTFALAQRDASGTARLITNQGWALDYTTLAPLWHNPEIDASRAFVAQVDAEANEQLFIHNNNGRFAVYDATDGSLADWTTPIIGSPRYVLKLPAGDAVVAYSSTDSTARVYRVHSIEAPGLTCSYYPGDPRRIILRWPRVGTAVAYEIYSGSDLDSMLFLEATLPATAVACTLAASTATRFYQMRPVMPAP